MTMPATATCPRCGLKLRAVSLVIGQPTRFTHQDGGYCEDFLADLMKGKN